MFRELIKITRLKHADKNVIQYRAKWISYRKYIRALRKQVLAGVKNEQHNNYSDNYLRLAIAIFDMHVS